MLAHYEGNMAKALLDLFPYIGLDKRKFIDSGNNNKLIVIPYIINNYICVGYLYWSSSENRKRFFDSFAEKNEFNPLHPSSWYSISKENLHKQKVLIIIKYDKILKSNLIND